MLQHISRAPLSVTCWRQSGCHWNAAFVGLNSKATGALLQVRRALDWLRGERQESRRYAAVLILRQMALNAPAVFNVHVRAFIDVIWTGLRDPKLHIRESAVDALRVRCSSDVWVGPWSLNQGTRTGRSGGAVQRPGGHCRPGPDARPLKLLALVVLA